LIALAAWGVARLTVCWGDYGWVGAILCHAQWGTFAALLGAAAAFCFLVQDISEPALDAVSENTFVEPGRVAGLSVAEGGDFAHANRLDPPAGAVPDRVRVARAFQ